MNLKTVEQIVALMGEYPVSEITLEQDGQRVCVRKSPDQHTAAPPMSEISAEAPVSTMEPTPAETQMNAEAPPVLLTAPMVGLFHHLAPPIGYGGMLVSGQAVGSIESMKLMNDVEADQGGRVMEVLVEDGTPVEYGQPLFRLAAG